MDHYLLRFLKTNEFISEVCEDFLVGGPKDFSYIVLSIDINQHRESNSFKRFLSIDGIILQSVNIQLIAELPLQYRLLEAGTNWHREEVSLSPDNVQTPAL